MKKINMILLTTFITIFLIITYLPINTHTKTYPSIPQPEDINPSFLLSYL